MSLPPIAFGSDLFRFLQRAADSPSPDVAEVKEVPSSSSVVHSGPMAAVQFLIPAYFRESGTEITVADVGKSAVLSVGLVLGGIIAINLSPMIVVGASTVALLSITGCQEQEDIPATQIGFNSIIMPGFGPAEGWSSGEQPMVNEENSKRPASQLLEVAESIGKLPESDELLVARDAVLKMRTEVEIQDFRVPGHEINTMNLGLCKMPLADSKTREAISVKDAETGQELTAKMIAPTFALFDAGTVAFLSCDAERLGNDPIDIEHPACTAEDAKTLFGLSASPPQVGEGTFDPTNWIGCFERTFSASTLPVGSTRTLGFQYVAYDEQGKLTRYGHSIPHVLSPKIRVVGEEDETLAVPLTYLGRGTDTQEVKTRYTWGWSMTPGEQRWPLNFGKGLAVRGLRVFAGEQGGAEELFPSTIHVGGSPCRTRPDVRAIDIVDYCGQNVTPTYRSGALLPPEPGQSVLPMDWKVDFLVPLKGDEAGDPPVALNEPLTLELEISSRPVD